MPLRGVRVLVVEDHADSRDVLEQSLTFFGAEVHIATTARDALHGVGGVDIVVTDFVLPDENGVWLLDQLRRVGSVVPVILVSGYDESQVPQVADAPFTRKILKPIDPEALAAEIRRVLAGH